MLKARRSSLVSIETNRGRIKGVVEVKEKVKRYFEERFKKKNHDIRELDGIDVMRLSLEVRDKLEEKFSYEEMKRAIWESYMEKSPGLDGYNFSFLNN